MSNFVQNMTQRIDFDNGYSIYFESATGGTIYAFIFHKDERVDLTQFTSKRDKNDGFRAYLTPEHFAEVLYKVSQEEAKVEG